MSSTFVVRTIKKPDPFISFLATIPAMLVGGNVAIWIQIATAHQLTAWSHMAFGGGLLSCFSATLLIGLRGMEPNASRLCSVLAHLGIVGLGMFISGVVFFQR